jgi:hypothetical protein
MLLSRLTTLLICTVAVGTMCRAADLVSGGEAKRDRAFPVYKSPPIEVDGVLEETAWKTARRIPIRYVNGKKDRVAEDASSEFMLAWDERYLYVGYRYNSPIPPVSYKAERTVGTPGNLRPLLAIGSDIPIGAPRPHIFELNVDLTSDGLYVWELHHSAQDCWLPKLCIRPRDAKDPLWNLIGDKATPVLFIPEALLRNDGEYKLKTAVRNVFDVKGATNRYAGYTTEWAVPLAGLGAPLDRRNKDGVYRLDGHSFRAFGGEWRMTGSEAPFYHSVPGSEKQWFVDTLLVGHVFVFRDRPDDAAANQGVPYR